MFKKLFPVYMAVWVFAIFMVLGATNANAWWVFTSKSGKCFQQTYQKPYVCGSNESIRQAELQGNMEAIKAYLVCVETHRNKCCQTYEKKHYSNTLGVCV